MKIGFVGLGNMGTPMSINLANAGYDVSGFDIEASCPAEVKEAASAESAMAYADVFITMLPDGRIMRNVAEQVIPAARTATVFLDCSTVDITSARAVAKMAKQAGLRFMDAPVSGGVVGAENGTLTFMTGGSSETFETVAPLLEVMGAKAVHCGPAGSGQAAKICNNMLCGANMIAACEAFGLADRLGLDRQKMFDVVSTSSGYSWSTNAYCPAPGIGPKSPADNNYKPGFSSDLMLKDLRLARDAAEGTGAETPIGRLACAIYEEFVDRGNGAGRDFSAIFQKYALDK